MKYKLLVMDVDGTLTDGKIYFTERGEEFKAFNIKDGYGIKNILRRLNIEPAIITGRQSRIVSERAKELAVDQVYQGIDNKIECLKKLITENGCLKEEVIYVGDDENDLECIRFAGLGCCPQDADENVKLEADYITERRGGEGVIREIIDWLSGEAKKKGRRPDVSTEKSGNRS